MMHETSTFSTLKLMAVSMAPSLLSVNSGNVVTPFLELPWYTQLQWTLSVIVAVLGGYKMLRTIKWQHRKDREWKQAVKNEGEEPRSGWSMWGRILRWKFADKIMKARKKEAADEQAK